MTVAIILYILGAYIMFLAATMWTEADRNMKILLIMLWPLAAAVFMIGMIISLFGDWWEGRNGD